jgi:hypothetical protein
MVDDLKQRAADRKQSELGGQEATPGYSVNGESLHSRRAASGGAVDTTTATNTKERQEWARLDVMIKHEAYVVERLERRAAEARGTDKHAKICVRLQRTRALLTRLRDEQRAAVP